MRLRDMLESDEMILWQGYKAKRVSILEAVINPFLPFAVIWGCVDMFALGQASKHITPEYSPMIFAVIPFMLLHMMPVWLYLFGALTAGLRARNTEYLITNKNIYVKQGVFSIHTEVKPLADVLHISMNQGVFDRMCGTGDIVCECNHGEYNSHSHERTSIDNIEDYERVFKLLKQVQNEMFDKQHGSVQNSIREYTY